MFQSYHESFIAPLKPLFVLYVMQIYIRWIRNTALILLYSIKNGMPYCITINSRETLFKIINETANVE